MPSVGAKNTYTRTLMDNRNNTTTLSYTDEVTAITPGGTGFTLYRQDPSNTIAVTGTVDHSIYPTTIQNNAQGQILALAIKEPSGPSTTCIYSPNNGAAPSPLPVGQGWSLTISDSCLNASAPVVVAVTGAMDAVESITVPAGTFNAFKSVATWCWTVNGQTTTQTSTQWTDASGKVPLVLKVVTTFSFSGGAQPPAGTAVSSTDVLQSTQ